MTPCGRKFSLEARKNMSLAAKNRQNSSAKHTADIARNALSLN
jgi:hypothetical protein